MNLFEFIWIYFFFCLRKLFRGQAIVFVSWFQISLETQLSVDCKFKYGWDTISTKILGFNHSYQTGCHTAVGQENQDNYKMNPTYSSLFGGDMFSLSFSYSFSWVTEILYILLNTPVSVMHLSRNLFSSSCFTLSGFNAGLAANIHLFLTFTSFNNLFYIYV